MKTSKHNDSSDMYVFNQHRKNGKAAELLAQIKETTNGDAFVDYMRVHHDYIHVRGLFIGKDFAFRIYKGEIYNQTYVTMAHAMTHSPDFSSLLNALCEASDATGRSLHVREDTPLIGESHSTVVDREGFEYFKEAHAHTGYFIRYPRVKKHRIDLIGDKDTGTIRIVSHCDSVVKDEPDDAERITFEVVSDTNSQVVIRGTYYGEHREKNARKGILLYFNTYVEELHERSVNLEIAHKTFEKTLHDMNIRKEDF